MPPFPTGELVAEPHQLTQFSVLAVLLLHFLTCGVFSFIWLNLMHGRLPKVRKDDPSAAMAIGFCFIPFYNLYWIFSPTDDCACAWMSSVAFMDLLREI